MVKESEADKTKHVHEHIHYEKHLTVKKVGIWLVLAWIVGSLSILAGIGLLVTNILAGLLIGLGGLILLPPLGNLVKEKFNIEISGWLKFILFLVLLGIGSSIGSTDKYSLTSPENEVSIPKENGVPIIEEMPTRTEDFGMIATVNSAEKRSILGDCGEYGFTCMTAGAGKTFLIVDINVENKNVPDEFFQNYVSGSDFKIKDSNSYVYNFNYASSLILYALQL